MNKSMTRPMLALALLGSFAVQAGTWVNRPGVGDSLETAADYFDPDNWSDGTAVVGNSQTVTVTGDYVKVSHPLSLQSLFVDPSSAGTLPVVFGDDEITLGASSTSKTVQFWDAAWYVPIYYTLGSSSSRGHGILCAPLRSDRNFRFAGRTEIRFDRYALNANPVRVNEFNIGWGPEQQSDLSIYGPEGLDAAATSAWMKTPGSAFLHRKAGTTKEHALPVGTLVSGSGIPEGAFLRRIFDDDTIEISAPIVAPVVDDDVTFSPFAPDVTQKFNFIQHYNSSSTFGLSANKSRAQDGLLVRVGYLVLPNNAANNKFAVDTAQGYYPGLIEYGAQGSAVVDLRVGTCNLMLTGWGAPAGHEREADIFKNSKLHQKDAQSVSRIIVTNNLTATIGRFESIAGSFLKDGAGRLVVSIADESAAANTGSITVEAGTLCVNSLNESAPAYISTLVIKSGATLEVPEEGFACGTLVAEEGAILSGSGPMSVGNLSDELLRRIEFRGNVCFPDPNPETGALSFEFVNGSATPTVINDDLALSFDANALLHVRGEGTVQMLLVGGGGGGGAKGGGGGGGGGVVHTTVAVKSGYYPVVVGQGGSGAPDKNTLNTNGGDSSFFGLCALGGGAGGTYGGGNRKDGRAANFGADGGSGGGGGIEYPVTSTSAKEAGSGTVGQGFAGGHGQNVSYPGDTGRSCLYSGGGGGGGAGGVGLAPVVNVEGDVPVSVSGANGGDGVFCEILGAAYYGGGGGGGNANMTTPGAALGGKGGGGNGAFGAYANLDGQKGADGLGGGGGGGSPYSAGGAGGKGGDGGRGAVILRWKNPTVRPVENIPDVPVGTGGCLRRRGGYAVHTFTNDGSLVLSENVVADILLVGGGGGGGSQGGGGGGAGGVVIASNVLMSAGTHLVTVGAGGLGAIGGGGLSTSGSDTAVDGCVCGQRLVALGGGGGGTRHEGTDGGSSGGGGAPYVTSSTLTNLAGKCTRYGQGNVGGLGVHKYTANITADWPTAQGGGGGGAGAPGGDATVELPGDGGDGLWCDFSGRNVCYGGGGGGGSSIYIHGDFVAKGGLGGGGGGGGVTKYPDCTPGVCGIDGLGGGGGGGGGASSGSGDGGNGGSGIVVIRYQVRPLGMVISIR